MSWFDKLMPSRIRTEQRSRSVPEGLWVKCPACSAQLYRAELKRNLSVCPKCGHHLRINARERLESFLDAGSAHEIATDLEPRDPLRFKDTRRYRDRLMDYQKRTGERDALIVMAGSLKSIPLVAAAFEFRFMAGSMGSVVGEKIARLAQRSVARKAPLIIVSASGGARMQEGVLSLMQMAKTSVVLAELGDKRVPFVSVLTNPTTGGVSASFAMQGDVILAEPGAVVGFAGPRVIKQTIGQDLPQGFQTAEFLLDHGMIDAVVPRSELRDTTAQLLRHTTGSRPAESAD